MPTITSMAVTVRDLPYDWQAGVYLYCSRCRSGWSANQSDYFAYPLDHVLTCCGEPMELIDSAELCSA